MRVLPKLGQEIVGQIEEAWKLPQKNWARKRLLVVLLIAQHEHTVAGIMKSLGSVARPFHLPRQSNGQRRRRVAQARLGKGVSPAFHRFFEKKAVQKDRPHTFVYFA